MELSGWSIYFGSFVLFFLIGFTIISHFLFEDHEIKSKIPLFIFSVVFGFAMMMLQMVFFEIAGVGTQEYHILLNS
jgi:ABC-type transport system involved in cytochrome c biogenesis permease subunit